MNLILRFLFFLALVSCSILNKSDNDLRELRNVKLKSIIFFDDFTDNSNDWELINEGEFRLNIIDGKLQFNKLHDHTTNNGCMWYSKSIKNFKTNDDFLISFDVRFCDSIDKDKFFDFQWGDLNNKLYQMSIYEKGHMTIKYFEKGKDWSESITSSFYQNNEGNILGWCEVPSLSGKSEKFYPFGINHIDILQVDQECMVYVNSKKIAQVTLDLIEGDKIGFQKCMKANLELDNLEIRQKYK